ncbi:MAG: response regulator transcription factor [Chloroflexi bacterium]|nr:response regulator transcription factor [Chloroflexota bacterium]
MQRSDGVVILIIEGGRGNYLPFSAELREKGYQVNKASSGSAGLELLDVVRPHVVVVDAASLRTSGVRICQSFRISDDILPIILIVEKDISLPDSTDANLVLRLPFTIQKLINRLRAFHPTDQKHIVQVGPIELNTLTQLVTCNGRQTKLTPRLVKILRMLMENNGKVVERDPLFTEIWETEYTGDTRTLDVHISWLRQAIEEDPRNPQLIRTERGVGYILRA